MKKKQKRILCLLLTMSLIISITSIGAASTPSSQPDYTLADKIFEGLETVLHSRKALMDDETQADLVLRYLNSAEGVSQSSIRRIGNSVYWQTDDQITCHFSPYLQHLKNGTSAHLESLNAEVPQNYLLKSTSSSRDVYLIAPYYGLDNDFDGEDGLYGRWAKSLAHYTGGKAHILTQRSATVDAVARAIENGAIVLIDSHGDTDSEDGNARTSYICLQSSDGISITDFAYDSAAGISHACYGGLAYNGNVSYYEVDGTVISRHMKKKASSNLIWNGTCYGMASNGFCAPLIAKGVDSVYGYSQAVSFGADKCWLDTAMSQLTNGKSLSQAVNETKRKWGYWDYSQRICEYNAWPALWINYSAEQAASHNDSFPIVVSAKDSYPGNPNTLQNVLSDWMLPRIELTLDFCVPDGVKCPKVIGYVFYQGRLPTPAGIPRNIDQNYSFVGWSLKEITNSVSKPTIYVPGTPFSFGFDDPSNPLSFGDHNATLFALYSYSSNGQTFYTTQVPSGPYDPYDPSALFDDMPYGTWYYNNVRYAIVNELVNGYTDHTFRPQTGIRRSEVVSILYRAAGSPDIAFTPIFDDVPETIWYADAVTWAVQNSIVEGFTDNSFRPDLPVTRAQLAAFFYRYSKDESDDISAIYSFPDCNQVPEWACKEYAWAVENHLINGNRIDGLDYLQPLNQATRAQFVAILERFISISSGGNQYAVQ